VIDIISAMTTQFPPLAALINASTRFTYQYLLFSLTPRWLNISRYLLQKFSIFLAEKFVFPYSM